VTVREELNPLFSLLYFPSSPSASKTAIATLRSLKSATLREENRRRRMIPTGTTKELKVGPVSLSSSFADLLRLVASNDDSQKIHLRAYIHRLGATSL